MGTVCFLRRQLPARSLVLCLLAALLLAGCASTGRYGRALPPIFTQEQLSRPYVTIGQVTVSRERYGAPEDIDPADYEWANQALREEAAKVDADAIIFPEVKVQHNTYIFFPSSEITAQATAIRFR